MLRTNSALAEDWVRAAGGTAEGSGDGVTTGVTTAVGVGFGSPTVHASSRAVAARRAQIANLLAMVGGTIPVQYRPFRTAITSRFDRNSRCSVEAGVTCAVKPRKESRIHGHIAMEPCNAGSLARP